MLLIQTEGTERDTISQRKSEWPSTRKSEESIKEWNRQKR